MDQAIIDYIEEHGAAETKRFQHKFLTDVTENMGCTLQLDAPIIRVMRDDGVQICTVDVPTGEAVFIDLSDLD